MKDQRAIRFCVQNPRSLDEREQLFNAGYECRDCLANCTRCFETRFLEIDNELIEGESYSAILNSASDSVSETNELDNK